MSVQRGVRCVGGVCEIGLARCGVGVKSLGLGFTSPVGTEGVWDVGLCLSCSGVGGRVAWASV